jgi:hypothetical protein
MAVNASLRLPADITLISAADADDANTIIIATSQARIELFQPAVIPGSRQKARPGMTGHEMARRATSNHMRR